MTHKSPSNIVVDGRSRILADELPEIERKVREKYAQRLAEAGFLRRFRIRRRIRREILEELERIAPKGALYFQKDSDRDHAM